MRRRWLLIVGLAIAGFAAALWYFARPRVITVCLVTDETFRQYSDWMEVLDGRIAALNKIYEHQVGIQWRVIQKDLTDPTTNLGGLDVRRTTLLRSSACNADLILAITGRGEAGRTASVSPFSHAAIIVDNAGRSEAQNTIVLAHELAHLFGAVHDEHPGTLMGDQPVAGQPGSDIFPPRTANLIRQLRGYDFSKGVSALQGRWDGRVLNALEDMLRGLAKNPKARANQIMAAALVSDGENELAVPHLQAALTDDPKNAQARFDLSVALEQTGHDDVALTTLREGIELNPRSARLHSALGALVLKQDKEQAIDEFMASLRLDPNNPALYTVLGGVLVSSMGRIDTAIAAYQNALKLAPRMAAAQQGLDQAIAAKDHAMKEVVLKRREAAANANQPAARYDLGVAEANSGNFELAAKAFEESIRLQPGFGLAHANLALMRYLTQDYPGASKEVAEAKAAGTEPDAAFVAALKRKLPQ